MKLKAFSKFENTSEALSAATLLIDSKPSKGLRKFLKAHCDGETLGVADSKLGNAIKEKLVCFLLMSVLHFLVCFGSQYLFLADVGVGCVCSKLIVFIIMLSWN